MGDKKPKRLKKELRLLDVYAIATGATLGAGLFLLPGMAASQAGSGLVLAYLLAALPMVPALLCMAELSTAMPRAGGIYYFVDRSLGPYIGTIGGIGTWLALVLKISFALVGMGAYAARYIPDVGITPVALLIALVLGGVNLLGSGKGGQLQVLLVVSLLAILALFTFGGLTRIGTASIDWSGGGNPWGIVETAALLCLSYVGISKVSSLSEEVDDPERNLPMGIILSLGSALLIYGVVTYLIVLLLPMDQLSGNLTAIASAAAVPFGRIGEWLLSFAAIIAFVSVSNAGIMSASRYPLAMARDHLLPGRFRRLDRQGTPVNGIVVTTTAIMLVLLLFDPLKIAKLASAFHLLMFSLISLSVIVMRESQIPSYDPGYRSPLYPWLPLAGIVLPLLLLVKMGMAVILGTVALIAVSSIWYFRYARHRVDRAGGIFHVFERLGRNKHAPLDAELRGIMREKGLREEDPFDEIVSRAIVHDVPAATDFTRILERVAHDLATIVPLPVEDIVEKVMEGSRIGATPVTRGIALPHFRSSLIEQPEMVLVRGQGGIRMQTWNPLTYEEEAEITVSAIFFLVSPDRNPAQHLRILARIAERVDEPGFAQEWNDARDAHGLRSALMHDDHFLSLTVRRNLPTEVMIGNPLRSLSFPPGCLVALLGRGGHSFVPNGNTVLQEGDWITIIGDPRGLTELKETYQRH